MFYRIKIKCRWGIIPIRDADWDHLSRWAEINAPQTPLEEKLSFPPMAAPRLRGGRLRGGKGGNPRIYGGERKVQLIMFTYLIPF